jgi:outer membrane protein assembly factor BamB
MDKKFLSKALILFIVFSSTLFSADWTKWRGPNSNGSTPETGWNPMALTEGVRILWQTDVGNGHSSFAVKGDRIFTMGNRRVISGSDTVFTDIVYCLDNLTGNEIWQYVYPCKEGLDPGPGSSPVLDGNRLYTLSREGHLFCFEAESGRILWQLNLIAESLTETSNWGFSCSPVIDGNHLIINANRSGLVLDKNTGKTIWNSRKKESFFSSVTLYSMGNKRMAVITTRDTLIGVEIETGKVQWSYPWMNPGNDPIIIGTDMFAIGRGCALLDLSGPEPVEIWKNNQAHSSFQSWTVYDGYGYGFDRVRRSEPVTCLDLKNGEVKWSQDVGNMGAVITAMGKLIILTRDGRIIIAEASPEGFQEISSAEIVPMADNTGVHNRRQCHCWINPVLSNGKLYARNTYGDLVCVDLR